jgi:hypothetical protein
MPSSAVHVQDAHPLSTSQLRTLDRKSRLLIDHIGGDFAGAHRISTPGDDPYMLYWMKTYVALQRSR